MKNATAFYNALQILTNCLTKFYAALEGMGEAKRADQWPALL
jgi:hypothetical protein